MVGDKPQTLIQTVHIRGGTQEEEESSSKKLEVSEGDEMTLSCLTSTQAGNTAQVSWSKKVIVCQGVFPISPRDQDNLSVHTLNLLISPSNPHLITHKTFMII